MADSEPRGRFSLDESYDDFPRIEGEFNAALTASLHPRSPEFLYDIVAALGLPDDASAVDVGCGEGRHTLELARRFGFSVVGVEPVQRHLELANGALALENEDVRGRVQFIPGSAEDLPLGDESADLVWCREVLYIVPALEKAIRECRRIRTPDGRMVIYQAFFTDRLEPREAEWLSSRLGIIPRNADRIHFEEAIAAAGFRIEENVELGSETGEWAEEQDGRLSRELLAAARLLRDPERYINRFGRSAYEIKLGDSFWHICRMIGKLSTWVYVLRVRP